MALDKSPNFYNNRDINIIVMTYHANFVSTNNVLANTLNIKLLKRKKHYMKRSIHHSFLNIIIYALLCKKTYTINIIILVTLKSLFKSFSYCMNGFSQSCSWPRFKPSRIWHKHLYILLHTAALLAKLIRSCHSTTRSRLIPVLPKFEHFCDLLFSQN